MQEKAKAGELHANGSYSEVSAQQKKKRRWDQAREAAGEVESAPTPKRRIEAPTTPSQANWAETPGRVSGA